MAQGPNTNGDANRQGPRKDIDNATNADIIIVGAGPVGLLLALKLGLHGISTIVIEKHKGILKAPRAIAYMPVVNKQLKKIGLLEPIMKRAYQSFYGPCWRPVHGEAHVLCELREKVAQLLQAGVELPPRPPPDEDCVYMIGQDDLSEIILEQIHLRCPEHISVRFQRPCIGINDGPRGVEVMTTNKSPENMQYHDIVLTAKYVIGADGAQSAVRQYACIPFEGFTWTNFRFTAADIEYDFMGEMGYYPANFIVDPYNWAVIARTGPTNVFRIAYGELPDTPDDEASLLERSKERLSAFLSPTNKNYKLRRLRPYWAQQRCAQTFRKGRILLVGDAAHSNNPVGGLGLTSGILDSIGVGNAVARHLKGGEPEEIITRALESRRKTWLEVTNPTSAGNYLRLCSEDEKVSAQRAEFFHNMNHDPAFALGVIRDQFRLLPDAFDA